MKRRKFIGNAIAEFAPIVTFVIVSEIHGFEPALIALVFVATLTLLLEWYLVSRVPKFGLIASGTILLFGMLSIVTNDPFFIIIKDTLYALSFAIILLGGLLANRLFLKTLFGEFMAITERGWRILTYRWVVFFFLLAIANEMARVQMDAETWVYYKFGALFVTWVFGFYQLTLTHRERLPHASSLGLHIHS
jgi:intracellular septation protein